MTTNWPATVDQFTEMEDLWKSKFANRLNCLNRAANMKTTPKYTEEDQRVNLFNEYQNRASNFESSAAEFVKTITLIASGSIAFWIPILANKDSIQLINGCLFKVWMVSFLLSVVAFVLLNLASLWNGRLNLHVLKRLVIDSWVQKKEIKTKVVFNDGGILGRFLTTTINNSGILMVSNILFFLIWLILVVASTVWKL